jgi:hypothetical protein
MRGQGRLLASPPVILALQLLAYVFDGLSDLAATASKSFLDVAGRFVGDPFVMKALVVGQITCGLLDLALDLLGFAIDLVFVHRFASRVRLLQEAVRQQ